MSQKLNIREVKTEKFTWFDCYKPTNKELDALQKRFGFQAQDLLETLPPMQWSKMMERPNYIFIVFLFPFYEEKTKVMKIIELDIFITDTTVVTLHHEIIPQIEHIFNQCLSDARENICRRASTGEFIFELVEIMLESLSPILVHLSKTLHGIEKSMFLKFEKGIIKDILLIKTDIVNVRKALSGKTIIIKRLTELPRSFMNNLAVKRQAERTQNFMREVNEVLSSDKETIDAFHQTATSLLNYRVNEIMKTLTIFSVIVFPLTLMAAIFGMNASAMPFVDHPLGFWYIILLMMVSALGMLGFFKWRKWL